MLMRFDPYRDMESRVQLFNRQMGALQQPTMSMDAYRQGDSFVVHFDLPGVDPESIDLTVEKNVLTVRAERNWQSGDDQEVLISERPQGTFTRQLFLGESLDAEHIQATYRNGVLTLTIPVAEQAKPRKVEVMSGPDQATEVRSGSSSKADAA
jgi:HSP20 family protein